MEAAKLAAAFVSPLGLVFFLLVSAVAKGQRSLALAALIVLYLCSTRLVGEPLMFELEADYPTPTLREAPKADAIVVLGGSVKYAATTPQRLEWGDAADRFDTGLRLFAAGAGKHLVFTGNTLPLCSYDLNEPVLLGREAVRRGVPESAILRPRVARNTEGDAQSVAALSTNTPVHRIILVTSAWHLRRATYIFRDAGFDVVPYPCDFRIPPGIGVDTADFIPSVDGLTLTSLAFREHLGLAWAKVRRWKP
jgi:uncharacterized SAM-binding protein YcdF (DUF218 family)